MDVNKIEELINVLEGSRTEELSVRKGTFAVHIVKGKKVKPAVNPTKRTKPTEPIVAALEPVDTAKQILAPMVGIFHAAEEIGKPEATVKAGQIIGSIESMKLLNDVVAEISGQVVEMMVEDGTPVEYGQPLCRVEVSA